MLMYFELIQNVVLYKTNRWFPNWKGSYLFPSVGPHCIEYGFT